MIAVNLAPYRFIAAWKNAADKREWLTGFMRELKEVGFDMIFSPAWGRTELFLQCAGVANIPLVPMIPNVSRTGPSGPMDINRLWLNMDGYAEYVAGVWRRDDGGMDTLADTDARQALKERYPELQVYETPISRHLKAEPVPDLSAAPAKSKMVQWWAFEGDYTCESVIESGSLAIQRARARVKEGSAERCGLCVQGWGALDPKAPPDVEQGTLWHLPTKQQMLSMLRTVTNLGMQDLLVMSAIIDLSGINGEGTPNEHHVGLYDLSVLSENPMDFEAARTQTCEAVIEFVEDKKEGE